MQAGRWAGQQAGIFEVRFERDREINWRGKDTKRQRYIGQKRQRDGADNKNPEQSRVAQLVSGGQKVKFHEIEIHFFMRSNS